MKVDTSYEACVHEVEREIQVRARCYPRWVSEGKLSEFEAAERLERLKGALQLMQRPEESY